MKDQIERMVAAAKAKAIEARAAEATREREERERRIALDEQVAEMLLNRVRPVLEGLVGTLNKQIEGDWHVEWHATKHGHAALRLESPEHAGFLAVAISREWQVTLSQRTGEYDQADSQCELAQLEARLICVMQEWVERLMVSPQVRLRS